MSISDSITRAVTYYTNLNIPNFITISRFIAIPFFIVALAYHYNGAALVIFVLCGLTDALDGYIARTYHQRTEIGAFLDPLADKLLLISTFVTLALVETPNQLPFWLIVTVISRDVIIPFGIGTLLVFGTHVRMAPTKGGKATTTLQILLIILVLFLNYTGEQRPAIILPLCWLTFAFTLVSGLDYVYKGIQLVNSSPETLSNSHDDSA